MSKQRNYSVFIGFKIIAILLLLPSLTFADWAASTSFETTDGSTIPTDGVTIHNTGDGSGWSDNWTESGTGDWIYDDDVAGVPNGTFVAQVDTGPANLETALDRTLNPTVAAGDLTFSFRINKTNRNNHNIIFREGGTNRFGVASNPQQSGPAHLVEAVGGSTIASDLFSADTWYTIRINFDCSTDTFDVYVDNVLKGDNVAFSSACTTAIDAVRLSLDAVSTPGSSAGSIFYIDFIQPVITASNSIRGFIRSASSFLRTGTTNFR